MSLLNVLQNVADIVGVPRPSGVTRNPDKTVRRMVALLNKAGRNMARERNTWNGGWAALEQEHVFQTVRGVEEYELPGDFGEMIDNTLWDRTDFWRLRGQLGPQEWQRVRSGILSSGSLRQDYRIRRSAYGSDARLWIYPVPTREAELAFEYITYHHVKHEGDNGPAFFEDFARAPVAADEDESLLDEDLLEMSLTWRWKEVVGVDYLADLTEFETQQGQRMGTNSGSETISLVPMPHVSSRGTIPESGFGGL